MGNKIKVIVFDLGNVLIDFDHSKWIIGLNKIGNGYGDKIYDLYLGSNGIGKDYEAGQISDDDFVEMNLNILDNKISGEEFCKIFSEIFTENTKMTSLLPRLKENYKVLLLSNTSEIHKKYGWGHYPFLKYFDGMILSHEVLSIKPNPNIYKAAEELSKEKPEAHIFIDDLKENVEGAKKLGWDGIHFIGYENLLDEFNLRNIF